MDASTRWTIVSDGAGRDVLSSQSRKHNSSPAREPVPADKRSEGLQLRYKAFADRKHAGSPGRSCPKYACTTRASHTHRTLCERGIRSAIAEHNRCVRAAEVFEDPQTRG